MSTIGLDVAEQSALNSTNIGSVDYFKEITSNRAYHFFEVPKLLGELAVKLLKQQPGSSLEVFSSTLGKVVKTENIIFFAQDMIAFPERMTKLYNRVVEWKQGVLSLKELAHECRKFVGHLGSTIGDYADACGALRGVGANVARIDVISERIGSFGSALGAASRITDYALGDTDSKPKHTLTPEFSKLRKSIAESRDQWNLSRDVTILALSVLCMTVGFGSLPAILSIGMPGVILGSRMTAFYREKQLEAIDASYTQMTAAKSVLKG